MSNQTVALNVHIHAILKKSTFDHFTVTEMRKHYVELSPKEATSDRVRHVVYRQIHRLVKHGILEKKIAENLKQSVFTKTKKFYETNFNIKPINIDSKQPIVQSIVKSEGIANIQEKLKLYKVDLLASVGESEEYMRLYETNPELKTMLEREYLQARDQSSRLLGQIKALQTVIQQCSS